MSEETIEEEDEDQAEEEEDAWMSMDKENISENVSKNQSVDGSLEQTVVPRGGTTTHLRVGVRLRPLGDAADVAAGGVSVDGDQVIVKGRVFPVSCVLGEDATQEEVYNKMVRPQVAQLCDDEACNSILFAYGPTGTGKTYTMGTGRSLFVEIAIKFNTANLGQLGVNLLKQFLCRTDGNDGDHGCRSLHWQNR